MTQENLSQIWQCSDEFDCFNIEEKWQTWIFKHLLLEVPGINYVSKKTELFAKNSYTKLIFTFMSGPSNKL